MTTFSDLGIDSDILTNLATLGYQSPTPVQEKVIPLFLSQKRDMISLAQTGTGKTAAFGIPLIQLTDCSSRRTQMLILCPTRELCVQVARDLTAYAQGNKKLSIVAVYGGARIDQQIQALRKGAQIIVATPGRLNDLTQRGKADISQIKAVVFDEADEMLQMGFQDELDAILSRTPDAKNTLLFSATMPKEVAEITSKYMQDPLEVTVGTRNAGASNVRHECYTILQKHRYQAIKRILDNAPGNYSIVFCRTRIETQEVANRLAHDNYNAEALHGDLSQAQRDQVMGNFRQKRTQILVATDVAARGLDVNDLTHVINYNLPDDTANYTHRSGRTGRAGKTGTSIAIITSREQYRLRAIENKIKKKFHRCKVPTGAEICKQKFQYIAQAVSTTEVDHDSIDLLYEEVLHSAEDMSKEELIKKILSLEYGYLFKSYKNAPDLNINEREARKKNKRDDRGKNAPNMPGRGTQFTRFSLNVGRKDGVLPQRLIGTINESQGGGRIRVGKIEILRNSAHLEADSKYIAQVISAFAHLKINGKPVTIQVAEKRQRPSAGHKNKNFRRGSKDRKSRKA